VSNRNNRKVTHVIHTIITQQLSPFSSVLAKEKVMKGMFSNPLVFSCVPKNFKFSKEAIAEHDLLLGLV
jgi:hypothetical protein